MKKKDTALEKEFKKISKTIGKEILYKAQSASKLMNEAFELAEKSGMPFSYVILKSSFTYTPSSFSKFQDLDKTLVHSLTGVYHDFYDDGWSSSSSCIDPD